jgi:hypothetical protein
MGFNSFCMLWFAFCLHFVVQRMGFNVSGPLGGDLLCTGAWVLTAFVCFGLAFA